MTVTTGAQHELAYPHTARDRASWVPLVWAPKVIYNHSCTLCDLHATAKTVCMGASGEPALKGMIIGEAPGANEDAQGTPFIGRAGKILDFALAEATGLTARTVRKKIPVTNAVKCRPPNNATPTAQQLDACVLYLEQEIEAFDPVAILSLGNAATITLLGTGGVSAMREEVHYLNRDKVTRVFVTFHPAFVARQGRLSDAAEMFKEDVAAFITCVKRYR